jgi:hypothetical protein
MLRELFEAHAEELVAKAIETALAGDAQALRMCLDRIVPAIKAREEMAALPSFTGTLTERGDAILNAMAQGQLTASEASSVLSALASQAKLNEIDELERRIAALEAAREKH